ncbi:MAG: hypothetical protein KAQ92_00590 [Candidatus Aenigmarchaeota archaeon]|nr:hypothetical protein [Candidatus Aenigmarchaeota archaeon]
MSAADSLNPTIMMIIMIMLIGTTLFFHQNMQSKMSDTQLNTHKMKAYKDALLVQFVHMPDLVVENEKGEPENFLFDADKVTAALINNPFGDPKKVPGFNIEPVSYHINVLDTQTGRYWDFKNKYPVDMKYSISVTDENLVWRYANIIYPDGKISTVFISAVFIMGIDDDVPKLKEGMKCVADADCVSGDYCTNGNVAVGGQAFKTCQNKDICTYSKGDGEEATSACECISQLLKSCLLNLCCDGNAAPAVGKKIKGQPCLGDAGCISNSCNDTGALPTPISKYMYPSEYQTCN